MLAKILMRASWSTEPVSIISKGPKPPLQKYPQTIASPPPSLDCRYYISFIITLSFLPEHSFTAFTAFHTKAQFIRPDNISSFVFGPIDVFLRPAKCTFAVSCGPSRFVSCSERLEFKLIDIR